MVRNTNKGKAGEKHPEKDSEIRKRKSKPKKYQKSLKIMLKYRQKNPQIPKFSNQFTPH